MTLLLQVPFSTLNRVEKDQFIFVHKHHIIPHKQSFLVKRKSRKSDLKSSCD